MCIENPNIIDVIIERDGQVTMVLLESRVWDGSRERMHQLLAKVNAYLAYVLEGHLASDHPALSGRPVVFLLRHVAAASQSMERFLQHVAAGVAQHNIEFRHERIEELRAAHLQPELG